MAKITLRSEKDDDDSVFSATMEPKITIEANHVVTLDEMFSLFTSFLRSCGYHFDGAEVGLLYEDDGFSIDIDDEYEDEEEDIYSADDVFQSKKYQSLLDEEEDELISLGDEDNE